MSFSFAKLFSRRSTRKRQGRKDANRLWLRLEGLEDRQVPSILFHPGVSATTSDGGGSVINNVHPYVVFWGNGWNSGSGPSLRGNILGRVDYLAVAASGYVARLSEYRSSIGAGSGTDAMTMTESNPNTSFTTSDVQSMLASGFRPFGPILDPILHPDSNRLYIVVPQPGSSLTGCGCIGIHGDPYYLATQYHYAVVNNNGSLDSITRILSHELVEAVSDPEGSAIQVNPRNSQNWNEIADNEAQNYAYRVDGVLEQAWFSQANHAYIVPTTQAQNFYVGVDRVLSVNGDQLGANFNDTITVGQTAAGGIQVTLNGEVAAFEPGQISSVTINPGGGTNTVNVEALPPGVRATVNDAYAAHDTINLSPTAHNLGNLQSSVTIVGNGQTSLNLFDQSGPANTSLELTPQAIIRNNNSANAIFESRVVQVTLHASPGAVTLQLDQGTLPPLAVDSSGLMQLTVKDQTSNAAQTTYGVSSTQITVQHDSPYPYVLRVANLAGLTLNTVSSANVVNVEGTPASTIINDPAASGVINLTPTSKQLGNLSPITVHGGGSTTLTADDGGSSGSPSYGLTAGQLVRNGVAAVTYDRLAAFRLSATANGNNTISVQSTAISTYVYGGTNGSVTVSPGAHNLDNIRGSLSVSGRAVVLYDQANPHGAGSTTYTLDANGLTRTAAGTAPVQIQSEPTTLYTSSSAAVVQINGDTAPLTVIAGAADTITVGNSLSSLDGFRSNVTVDAHGGTLTLDDRGTQNLIGDGGGLTHAIGFMITDHAVTRTDDVTETDFIDCIDVPPPCHPRWQVYHHYYGLTVNYTNLQSLTITGAAIATSFAIQSTAASTPIRINPSANSSIQVGIAGSVKGIHSSVTLNGQGAGITLALDDSQATTKDQVTVTPTQVGAGASDQFFGTGGSLTYSGIATVAVKTSNAADDLVLLIPSATTAFTVNGSAPPFQAGHAAQLALNLAGITNPINTPSGPGAGQWTFGNRQPVTYTNAVNTIAPATQLVVSAPGSSTAGGAFALTVTALNAFNQPATSYRGTIHFSSSDAQAALPANYTFTATDQGVHTFSVTLKTAGSQSLTATDTSTAALTGTESGIMVNPGATTRLSVTAPAAATAGTAFNLTVTAQDAYGNRTPAYTGTVAFTSTDSGAVLPANTLLSNGVGTFSSTLTTAGSQLVTATDTTVGTITGNATIGVVAAALDHFSVATSVDAGGAVAGNLLDVTVTAQDAYNNTVTTYTGTVTFSSQDPYGAALPADYTFQATDHGMASFPAAAALYTAGTWDVTATDTASGATGSDSIGVTAAPAVAFQLLAPASAASGQAFDLTVIAVDPYGNTDTNYQGTVTFTSSDADPGVVLPSDYTFQPSDSGVVTFPAAATLITLGDQTLTATDTNSGITGSATVTVSTGMPAPGPHRGGHSSPLHGDHVATALAARMPAPRSTMPRQALSSSSPDSRTDDPKHNSSVGRIGDLSEQPDGLPIRPTETGSPDLASAALETLPLDWFFASNGEQWGHL